MTLENLEYRTNPLFLRNQFSEYSAKFGIPIVPKPYFSTDELQNIRVLRFDQLKSDNAKHRHRLVHFFLYDYLFEKVWKNPEQFLEMLLPYRGVLTPDYSMYIEMPLAIQLYNTFRNRWCGAYFAEKGLRVIPSVSWGTEESFDFCFEGIEKNSIVAVSTYMFHAHGNHADQKDIFIAGYREMLKRIEPEYVICYSEPFPEMQGNIIYVDYDLSSWRHMQDDIVPSETIKHTHGILTFPEKYATITKMGCVCKGGGSANGGKWIPKTEKDKRLVGEPGEIKESYVLGYKSETKIGEDGYAVRERHHSSRPNPKLHSNPHDHEITWENNHPNFSEPHNYWDGNIPEFKSFIYHAKGDIMMNDDAMIRDDLNFPFESITEMKQSILWGGEVGFIYQGEEYGIFRWEYDDLLFTHGDEEIAFKDVDSLLKYTLNGETLKDILLKARIICRNI